MNESKGNRTKKRKTRKYLDEIRKKSLSSDASGSIALPDQSKDRRMRSNVTTKITNNRLTVKLGMFSKGVRSETITRPQLSEEFKARMDEDLYKIIDLGNGMPSHTVTSGAYEEMEKTNEVKLEPTDFTRLQDSGKADPDVNNIVTQMSQAEASPSKCSPDLCSPCFTPPNRIKKKNNTPPKIAYPTASYSNENIICIESSSSPSKDSSIDEELYEYYKEWMEDVPIYLAENVPQLIDDIYDSTKEYLQKIYTDNCQVEREDAFAESPAQDVSKNSIIEQTMKESILLNPIEYIKQYGQLDPTRANNSPSTPEQTKACKRRSTIPISSRSCKYTMVNNHTAIGEDSINYAFSVSPENYMSMGTQSDASLKISMEENNSINLVINSPVVNFFPRKFNL